MSGLIAACPTCVELQPPQRARRAWALFEHAVAAGHDLHDAAQAALWATQSGAQLAQTKCGDESHDASYMHLATYASGITDHVKFGRTHAFTVQLK